MRLHVMSDLHFEIRNQNMRDQFWARLKTHVGEAEAVVLAGDIGSIRKKSHALLRDTLLQFEDLYGQVFYIPGNHEFWHEGLRYGWQLLDRWQGTLQKTLILKPGGKFYCDLQSPKPVTIGGGSLWYPDCGDPLLKRWWCDYDNIPDAYTQIEKQHQEFLAQTSLPEVCITHHFPTAESIASQWRGEPTNVFFCADIGNWLMKLKDSGEELPKLWIHGHTHSPMDYTSLLGFRVYANPLGYPSEGENPKFWERLLVDTDPGSWQSPAP